MMCVCANHNTMLAGKQRRLESDSYQPSVMEKKSTFQGKTLAKSSNQSDFIPISAETLPKLI